MDSINWSTVALIFELNDKRSVVSSLKLWYWSKEKELVWKTGDDGENLELGLTLTSFLAINFWFEKLNIVSGNDVSFCLFWKFLESWYDVLFLFWIFEVASLFFWISSYYIK